MVTDIPEIDERRAYTIAEACKILGMHRNTLRRYTKDGRVRCETREADGRTLYRGAALRKLIVTTI